LLDCFWTSYFPITLVIGAISAATAPAATLAIVHEYRAKGPLTTILLGVVALDDALTVLLFAFAMSVAQSFVSYDAVGIHKVLLAPALSILLSLSIGGIVGLCLCKLIRFVPNREVMLGVVLGCIFLTAGLAESLWGHPLLANMMLGFVIANFVKHHDDLFAVVESIEEPLFGMFFALAGAHLDLAMVKAAGVLALMITLGRFSGKILGSIFGAQISHAPSTVKRYLGLALLPTAGVTVGLALKASEVFEASDLSELMVNGVLGSVIINELLTPFLVRLSLSKAGETIQQRRSTKEIEG
jgi:Kef-type K+ transport system membrane component KefB